MTCPNRASLLVALTVAAIAMTGCGGNDTGMSRDSEEGAAMWAAKMDLVDQRHAGVDTLQDVAADAEFCDLSEDRARWAAAFRDGRIDDVDHLHTVGAFIHTYCPGKMARFAELLEEMTPQLVPLLEVAVEGWDGIHAAE